MTSTFLFNLSKNISTNRFRRSLSAKTDSIWSWRFGITRPFRAKEQKFLLGNDLADIQKSIQSPPAENSKYTLTWKNESFITTRWKRVLMPYFFFEISASAACSCKLPLGWSAKPFNFECYHYQLFISWAKSYPKNFRITRQGPGINQCSFLRMLCRFGFFMAHEWGMCWVHVCQQGAAIFLNSWRGSFEDVFYALRGSYWINPNAESLFCNVGCTVTA